MPETDYSKPQSDLSAAPVFRTNFPTSKTRSFARRWLQPRESLLVWGICLFLLGWSWLPSSALDRTETWGFVTGGLCVWLVTKGNLWNWPIGLANNVFFAILFWRSRLFADMSLQGVYFALGVYGWWNWLHGGAERSALQVSRAKAGEWLGVACFLVVGTLGMSEWLVRLHGASPFWDSLTTALSLAAQYLLCRKRLDNWWLWIAADLVYVPLYLVRGLPLTAILYAAFLLLCLLGLRRWKAILRTQTV